MSRGALTIVVGLWLGCGSASPPPVLESHVAAVSVDAGVSDAASMAVIGRIIDSKPEGADVVLTIDKGFEDGLVKGWHGVVIDALGRPVPGEDVAIVRVEPNQCIGLLRGTRMAHGTQVRISEPVYDD